MSVRLELDVPEDQKGYVIGRIGRIDGVTVVRAFRLPDKLNHSLEQHIQIARVKAKIEELRQTAQITDQNIVRGIIFGYQQFLGVVFGFSQVRKLSPTDLPGLADTFAKIFSGFTEVEPKIRKHYGVKMSWNGEVIPPHQVEAVIERYGLLSGEQREWKDVATIFGKSDSTINGYSKKAEYFIRNNYIEMLQPFFLPRQAESTPHSM